MVGIIQINGKVRTFVVANPDGLTLNQIMGDNVEEGSVLVAYSYWSYNDLDAKFTHVKVKHESNGGYVEFVCFGYDKTTDDLRITVFY